MIVKRADDIHLFMINQLKRINNIPLFSAGFRPFFFGSAIYGVFVIIVWVLFLSGAISLKLYFDPLTWHAHEMLFGFAGGIIIGFLLTASQNWSGKRGVHGWPLFMLFVLWILGRIALLRYNQPSFLVSLTDSLLFPTVILMLIPYIGNKNKNFIFLILLSLLFTSNLLIHMDRLGIINGFGQKGLYLALDTIILMIIIIGGRVIPFFTSKAITSWSRKPIQILDILGIISAIGFLIADFVNNTSSFTSSLAMLTALVNGARIFRCFELKIFQIPILATLYFGAAWVMLGLFLIGLGMPRTISTHALAVGGIGVMIYGFITRVSLGHTGRVIKASRWMIAGYILINLSAITRILWGIIPTINFKATLHASATLWCVALLIFLIEFSPKLFSKRVDGL